MRAIDKLLQLINEADVEALLYTLGLENHPAYWIDDLPGFNRKVALVAYHTTPDPQIPLDKIATYPLFNTAFKYLSQDVVKKIMAGQIQFQPVTSVQIKANTILIINQNGEVHNWGDIAGGKVGRLG